MNLHLDGLTVGRDGVAVVGPLTGWWPGPGLHLIIGPTGSGKTTLLMTLAGFLPPIAGRVRVSEGRSTTMAAGEEGRPSLADQQEWHGEGRTCLAFQNPEQLFFLPTVGDEVVYALRARGWAAASAESEGRAWLERWGVRPDLFWERNPLTLSGGEKRRVALAACTVFRPPLILLDEPLAGLDGDGQDHLLHVLGGLAAEHLVVVVTHDVEPFLPLARGLVLLPRPAFARGKEVVAGEGGGAAAARDSSMAGCGAAGPGTDKPSTGLAATPEAGPPAPRWFGHGREFLAAALADPSVFPLPEWYRGAVAALPSTVPLPWPTAADVRAALAGGAISATATAGKEGPCAV
ncbi:MAG: ABC transporter ATP-binding protein [Candidatus Ozemobacter sibiricus]|jgi:energy-coupling factor transporter ATP-binding protein EcfA2|uniref:ABC transporter ATP-binding protein n=1 Tax=Candidatus Ozemobacter sibiricus TaxID=2268124 RepID=A0A367ZL62_9BACT|nr:MAG: ABC transporter ATP-binding protein [Candidatus Ozemobacter sibiricus]